MFLPQTSFINGGFMRHIFVVGLVVAAMFNAFAGGEEQQKARPTDAAPATGRQGQARLTDGQASDSTKVESSSNAVAEGRPGFGIKTIEVEEPEPDLWNRPTLTGNWNGTREVIAESGVSFSLGYKADNISNLSGGMERKGSYLHNIDLVIGGDGEKLLNWKGGSFLIHAMSNNGAGFSKFVGDGQIASNIDAPKMTKLYQAWAQQSLMGGRLSFLAGLYDLNSEFYVTKPSVLFMNSSFVVGKELSQTGLNGPSIFPNPSVAFRAKMQPSNAVSFQIAAFDAVPGSPNDPTSPSFTMGSDEGAFVIGEAAFSWKGIEEESIGAGKYTFGLWTYTSAFEEVHANTVSGAAVRSTANSGFYFLAEQSLYAETEDQGLSLFTRLGFANGRINQYGSNLSLGLVYVGAFPERDADKIGFAGTFANNSSEYKNATLLTGASVASAELTLELTYRALVTPWLAVQPDFQYIINPGTDPSLESASVFGTRFEIGF
jgi:porin